jgi:hypothetical protein
VPFPSLGSVFAAPGSTRTVTLRLLDAPAAATTPVSVSSSDPAIAAVTGPVVIPSGSTDATFAIEAGAAGSAVLTLVAGATGREVTVVSGAPSAGQTPPVVAPPIGVVVFEAGNAGTLFLEPGATRSFDLELLAFPSLGDLPVSAASLDASVATVTPALQTLATGEQAIALNVTALAAGAAETRIDLVFGVERRTLRVVIGLPEAPPLTVAPPVSPCIREPGFDPCPEFE